MVIFLIISTYLFEGHTKTFFNFLFLSRLVISNSFSFLHRLTSPSFSKFDVWFILYTLLQTSQTSQAESSTQSLRWQRAATAAAGTAGRSPHCRILAAQFHMPHAYS